MAEDTVDEVCEVLGVFSERLRVYAAGGYYYPGQDHQKLKDEIVRLSGNETRH